MTLKIFHKLATMPKNTKPKVDYTIDNNIVYFACSDEIFDWICNMLVFPWYFRGKIVHFGFWLQYALIKKRLLEDLKQYEKVYLTGYSLGGALAQLASLDLYIHGITSEVLVFGSPKPFYFGHREINLKKVICGRDIVPLLHFGFISVKGETIRIGEKGNPFVDHGKYGDNV